MKVVEKTISATTNAINGDRATAGRFARKSSVTVMTPLVTTRRPSALESRRFSAAINLFLSELVRQEIGRAGRKT